MVRNFDPAKLTRLDIGNFSNGGQSILDEVKPSFEYKDNAKTDKVNGLKVTVVFPANRYERLTVTVADPVDRLSAVLEKTPAGTPILYYFLIKNFNYPISTGDTGNNLVGQRANRITQTLDHFLQSSKYFVMESPLSEFFPNLLNWIHFRRIWWDMKKNDIIRHI